MATRITQSTVLPISLIIVIVTATVHATIMWSKMMNRLDYLAANQVTIADFQQFARQAEQMNPGYKSPDVFSIIQQRKAIYENR